MSIFAIDGVAIKNPTSFKIELYTLTKSTRVANGDMVMDFVANKRKFEFGYAAINGTEMNKIIDVLWTQLVTTKQCFHTLTYLEDEVIKTATVYAGSIPKQLHSAKSRLWVWKDVTFSLIER